MSTQTEVTTNWRPEDTLAHRLLLVRTSLGLSQRDAADRCGISYGSWQGMEDGRQARSLDVKVARISLALGVDRDWLMWGGALSNKNGPHPDDDPDGGLAVRRRGLEPRTRWLRTQHLQAVA